MRAILAALCLIAFLPPAHAQKPDAGGGTEIDQLRQQNAALADALRQAQAALREAQQGGASAKDTGDKLAACRTANGQMLKVGQEVLHLYEDQHFLSMVLQSYEPLLGRKRVELETLVQDYDDKLRDAAFIPGQEPPK